MSSAEEDLYYCCMGFCEAFFHYMCVKEKINAHHRFGVYDIEELEVFERFERDRLSSKFHRLKELVDKIDKDL